MAAAVQKGDSTFTTMARRTVEGSATLPLNAVLRSLAILTRLVGVKSAAVGGVASGVASCAWTSVEPATRTRMSRAANTVKSLCDFIVSSFSNKRIQNWIERSGIDLFPKYRQHPLSIVINRSKAFREIISAHTYGCPPDNLYQCASGSQAAQQRDPQPCL